jgi:hypothetical protein
MQGLIPTLLAALLAMGAARAADNTVPPPETVDKLAWLAGCWNVDGAEPGSGEQWSTAAGGTILGTSRTVKGGKTTPLNSCRSALPTRASWPTSCNRRASHP